MQKILTILGPTASGKSGLAVKLAKKFNGEIISADSRQVYKGLDIGTGKVTKKEMSGIPHHLLDVASSKKIFTVSDFKKLAEKAIAEIASRGKLPIICGGTGFYIQAVTENMSLPEVPPNLTLRKKLAEKSTAELFLMLQKLDPERASKIDKNNPHRLIRAIEIAKAVGKVPAISKKENPYDVLFIGIKTEDRELKEKIYKRLVARLKMGMIAEAEKLHKAGLSFKRMESLGLEYKYLAKFIKSEISREEFIKKLNQEIWHYAKRQKTWFKRNKRIRWFLAGDMVRIEKEAGRFLEK